MPPDPYIQIRTALLNAWGPDRAITIANLAAIARISHRAAEHLIQIRYSDFGFLLVSGSQGYYRPTSADHINHYAASLRSRCSAAYARLRILRREAARAGVLRDRRQYITDPPSPNSPVPPAPPGYLFPLESITTPHHQP